MEFVSASEEKRDRNEYFSGIGLNSGADFNRPFLKPPGGDSGQNSLECWDYTVELEMLKGPSDLHLAAELGKTLLERNRELEATIREMRTMIEDRTQEIEYLSKQTAALREVNNSRLRIYEQLEVSIQDLEKNNQRMNAESVIDKRKIKSLTETIEHLEAKCEELQRFHEESANSVIRRKEERLQSPERTQRKSNPTSPDVHNTSNEDTAAVSMASKALKDQVKSLLEDLHKTRGREAAEAKRKEQLEIELSCLTQENAGLKEQIEILKESDSKVYDDHLTSPDTTTSSMLCRKCMGFNDDTGSNVTMQDIMDDLEDMDESYEGECALIRLQNGGYAWGSQESLASRGQVMGSMGSKDPSPRSETSGTPHNSLLYELDTQYRVLIEKYEALVEANKQAELQKHKSLETGSFVHMGVDENSGPMGFVITEPNEGSEGPSIKCQRCATCTCDMKASTTTAKPLHEELSEVETASSGFSEEERRYITKTTQTDFQEWNFLFGETADDLATPTPLTSTLRFLDLKSPQNPCNSRFQNVPEVQKLFSEIFENLKRTDQANVPESDTKLKEKKREKPRSKTRNSSTSCKNSNKENLKPSKPEENKSLELKDKDMDSTEDKPNRPNFLDLETSSTCSSRSRRRRKSKNRKRMDHSAPAQDQTLKNTDKNITNLEKREESVAQTNLQPTKKTDTPSSHTLSDVNLSASLPEIRVKCPHKMKKKKQKSKVNQLENKHLSNVLGRPVPSRSPTKPTTVSSYKNQTQPGPSSHVLPSVQVANLIRVEKSYAEVLKSKPTGYH